MLLHLDEFFNGIRQGCPRRSWYGGVKDKAMHRGKGGNLVQDILKAFT